MTPDERDGIVLRQTEIHAALQPAGQDKAASFVAALMLRFPGRREADDDAKAIAAAYGRDLSRYPVWVLRAVCEAAAMGRVSRNPAFVPSSGELCRHADELLAPLQAERERLRRVAAAEVRAPVDEVARARMAARFADVLRDLRTRSPEAA